jgi:hypothetical protein
MPPLRGEVDDQRHVQTRIARPTFAPRHARTVIAVVEDDRVVGETVRLQFAQNATDLRIHHREPVVILRPVPPHLGQVRMIRRHAHPGGIMDAVRRVNGVPELAFVADGEVEHRKERLARLAVAVMRAGRGLVPDARRFDQVVVLLAVVRAIVTGLAQELREHLHKIRQPHLAAHVLGTGGWRIDARNDRRAGRRAHRCRRPRAQVTHPARRQLVEVRRGGVGVAVATELRPVVLAGHPEDVRPVGGGRELRRQNKNKEGEEGVELFHAGRGNLATSTPVDATPGFFNIRVPRSGLLITLLCGPVGKDE